MLVKIGLNILDLPTTASHEESRPVNETCADGQENNENDLANAELSNMGENSEDHVCHSETPKSSMEGAKDFTMDNTNIPKTAQPGVSTADENVPENDNEATGIEYRFKLLSITVINYRSTVH